MQGMPNLVQPLLWIAISGEITVYVGNTSLCKPWSTSGTCFSKALLKYHLPTSAFSHVLTKIVFLTISEESNPPFDSIVNGQRQSVFIDRVPKSGPSSAMSTLEQKLYLGNLSSAA